MSAVLAFLFLLAGIAAASAQLALRPVPEGPSAEGEKGAVRYERGAANARPGWKDRARKIWHGREGRYLFSEADLNALFASRVEHAIAIEGLEAIRVAEIPNVRFLEGDRVQVGMVLSFPGLSGEQKIVYQVRGKVVPGGFAPQMGWLGQCPVPLCNTMMLESVRNRLMIRGDDSRLARLLERLTFSREGEFLEIDVDPEK